MSNRITSAKTAVPDYHFHELVETCCVINGQPFRFNTPADIENDIAEQRRDYLIPIHNCFMPEVLLFFARQCEKSTTLSAKMATMCLQYPYYKWLYLNASLLQGSDFSKDKLDPMLMESPILGRALYNPRSHNINDKYFRNGSSIKLRGMFSGPDRARGISCDGICADEVQDILIDDLYVAFEAQNHSLHPKRIKMYAGTPKSTANTMEKLKQQANHHELVFKCEHCGLSQFIMIDNIGDKGLICTKCKKQLKHYNYKWMRIQKIDGTRLNSFRVPQVVIPTTVTREDKWAEVLDKLRRYPPHVFDNEVLALSSGDAARPVTESMFRACCDENVEFTPEKNFENVFIGVDYGRGMKSFTNVVVTRIISGIPHLIYCRKFTGSMADPSNYLPEIKRLYHAFTAVAMGTDSGDGFMQNSTLKHELGHDRVWVFCATGNLREDVRWDDDASQFSFSRTKQLTKRFAEIKMRYVKFPKYRLVAQFAQDFYNVFSEERPETRTFVYNHAEDEPDDFVHAWNNSLMAAEASGMWLSPIHLDSAPRS